MRDVDPAPSQLHHKKEDKGRITSDGKVLKVVITNLPSEGWTMID